MFFIKNNTGGNVTWVGHLITPSAYAEMQVENLIIWRNDADVIDAITSGDALVASTDDGLNDISDPNVAFAFLDGASLLGASQSNSTGFIYVSGDEFTDGSQRISIEQETNIIQVETRANGVWNVGELLIGGDSLKVGRNVTASAQGEFLVVNDLARDTKAIAIKAEFDDSGNNPPQVPLFIPRISFPVQPDFSVEKITKSQTAFIFSFNNSITFNFNIKSGSVGATSDITYTARKDSPFGPIVYQRTYPASIWPANSDLEIPLLPPLNLPIFEVLFTEYSSDEDFSILTNPSGRPYFVIDFQLYEFEEIVSFGREDRFVGDPAERVISGTDRLLVDKDGSSIFDVSGNVIVESGRVPATPLPPGPPVIPPFTLIPFELVDG